MTWQDIILEYRREISQLHKEIDLALSELEKKVPRSFEKAVGVLDNAIMNSDENLRLIKIMEDHVDTINSNSHIVSIDIKSPIVNSEDEDVNFKECFGEIL